MEEYGKEQVRNADTALLGYSHIILMFYVHAEERFPR